jgi:hypothetical protein
VVAVGDGGALIGSADGLTWSAAASPVSVALRAVTYSSRYVAVGAGGTVALSTDGITWRAASAGTTTSLGATVFGLNSYIGLGAGGALFVAY